MGRPLFRAAFWLALPWLLLAAACGSGGPASLADVAVSPQAVPRDWEAAAFDQEQGRALWDVLPQLLTSSSDARLHLSAFEDETGLQGAATILIQTDDPSSLPQSMSDDGVLQPLTRLLTQQDALLLSEIHEGDPGTYFTPTDEPVPGSLRSRLVRRVDEAYLYSDSVIFSEGSVLAVVTVWYPEPDGPFQDVTDLATEIEQGLRAYLGLG